jgi:hypothetical protein
MEKALRLDSWMRSRDYTGHDPFDLLLSPVARALTFGSRFLERSWIQLGKRSPVNVRALLRVPETRNAKAMGLVLSSHLALLELTGDERYRADIDATVDWLSAAACEGYGGAGWGYPFPWANREFFAPAGTPASVPTAFIGHALLDVAEGLRHPEALRLGLDACVFLERHLARIPGPDGAFCFSYTPLDRRCVHNANLLVASLLARGARLAGERSWREAALAATRYSVAAQRRSGEWPYGASERDAFIDSFHTSYNLVALHGIAGDLGTSELDDVIARGAAYWRRTFVGANGVSYFPGRAYPVDTHAVAHAILTCVTLRSRIEGGLAEAERLADWAARYLGRRDGTYVYQRTRFGVNRIAYMRWTQAWMLRALSALAVAAGAGRAAPAAARGAMAPSGLTSAVR